METGDLYFSNPYEQYCKENLSFLMKYLRQAKVSSGLDFMLEDFGFDQDDEVATRIMWSMYQHLSVNATRDKLEFKISYVLDANTYGENLLELLNAK